MYFTIHIVEAGNINPFNNLYVCGSQICLPQKYLLLLIWFPQILVELVVSSVGSLAKFNKFVIDNLLTDNLVTDNVVTDNLVTNNLVTK